MAHKCNHCGSADTQAGAHHYHCFVCNGWSDYKGNAVPQPSAHDNVYDYSASASS